MDNPTTLLVAIMFVTIIVMGLSNLLMTLSDIVGGQRERLPDAVHAGWLVVLLAAYFALFWETTSILEIEDWDFVGFVATLIGPVILFFGTNLLVALPDADADARGHYLDHSRRFFLLMIGVQAWIIGLDVVFDAVGPETALNATAAALLFGLALSSNYRLHVALSMGAWLLVAVRLGMLAVNS